MSQFEEIDERNAEATYLTPFMSGRWMDIPEKTLADLCETATYDFSLDHDDAHLKHARTISLSPKWTLSQLTDAVMLFACPVEPIDLSISRLATAARYLGFTSLTPYAAAICYFRFNSLKEEYKCQKKTKSVR